MRPSQRQAQDQSQAVESLVVTGASSGIGRHLAERFSNEGLHVFATARSEADLAVLSEIPRLTAVPLDVRNRDQVQALCDLVQSSKTSLRGLINNAGVGWLGPLPAFSEPDLVDIFDINVFGPHRLTNALLDLLLESRGRIVNIGSQGGVLSSAYFGPYCMTKHALAAYTVALDEELEPHGVRAAIVEPGGITSEIGEKSQTVTARLLGQARRPFADAALEFLERITPPAETTNPAHESEPTAPESPEHRRPSPPSIVGDAVEHALFSEEPRRHYIVGTRWEGDRVLRTLLERLVEANACPTLRYSRDELIAKLDEQLSLDQA